MPAVVFLFLNKSPLRKIYDKNKPAVWLILGAFSIAAIVAFVYLYRTNLYFENMFLPLFNGKPSSPEYTIICFPHIVDVISELLLLSPLLPLLLYASRPLRPALRGRPPAAFLLVMSAASLIFLLIIDPKLSMPRDWDLFALTAFPLVLFLIYNTSDEKLADIRRLFPIAMILLVFSTATYLIVNLKTDTSVAYTKYYIDHDPPKSLGSLRLLMIEYYDPRGETKKIDTTLKLIEQWFPQDKLYEDARIAIDAGDIDTARRIFRQIKPDRFSVRYHNLKGQLYLFDKRYDSALYEIRQSLSLGKYYGRTYLIAGLIQMRLDQDNQALQTFRTGYELEPKNDYILEEMGVLFFQRQELDSALFYFKKSVLANPNNIRAYYFLGELYENFNDIPNLIICTDYYRKYGSYDPQYKSRLARLEMYIENAPDSLIPAKIRQP